MSSNEIIQKKFIINKSNEETFAVTQKALAELGLKNLKTQKSVKGSYLLVEYKEGFMQKGEVEFNFSPGQLKTEFSIKWSSPSNQDDQSSENDEDNDLGEGAEIVVSIFSSIMNRRKSKLNPQQLIEALKNKIGAKEISASAGNNIAKEVMKEKEVIVKLRCNNCRNIFDETLTKCPSCGTTK
jgi:hypothetical protein